MKPSRRCDPSPRSTCCSRSRSPTTSTSTRRSTTQPTSGACSGPIRSRSRRTGAISRSAITVARARSSCRALRSCARQVAVATVPRPPAGVRPEPAARHRGRGRVRRRRAERDRPPGHGRWLPRPRVRGGAGERLERARHPGVGVRAARTVPRQVLRHVDLAVGRPPRGPRTGDGAGAGARAGTAAVSAGRRVSRPRSRLGGSAQRGA